MSNFQVHWSDLDYFIEPKVTLTRVWNNFGERISRRVNFFADILSCTTSKRGSYSINEKYRQDEPIKIIQQVCGSFKSGEITAIIGPSGAGKTSLLNFLSRRREHGYTGELYLESASRKPLKICTIPQDMNIPEYLTVRENLMFASRLNNVDNPKYDHETEIVRISRLLGIEKCLDTRTKKISGGQHKRLAIAQELLSKPDILILDEPTSGLDSLTCYKTVTVLKDLVQASANKLIDPIAILLTIHQPDEQIFGLFDKIYIMADEGKNIYNGPPNKCVDFVEKYSDVRLPSRCYDPASFLIQIASGEFGQKPIKALETRVKFEFTAREIEHKNSIASKAKLSHAITETNVDSTQKSPGKCQGSASSEINSFGTSIAKAKSSLYIDRRLFKASAIDNENFWSKTRILILRCWLSMIRDPKQLIARILFYLSLPFVMVSVVGREGGKVNACTKMKAEYDLRDLVYGDTAISNAVLEDLFLTYENIISMFMFTCAITMAGVASTTLGFNLDMQTSIKEHHNGWYSIPAYLVARIASNLPVDIILPVITMSIIYPLTGQASGAGLADFYRMLITSFGIVLTSLVVQTTGMVVGALYLNQLSTALFVSQAIILPMYLLSGFVAKIGSMSKFVRALSNLSVYNHCLVIIVAARYGFDICDCNPEEIDGRDPRIVGVPERFKQFVKFLWDSLQDSDDETSSQSSLVGNETGLLQPMEDDNKLFNLFAKQVSLFNTYGYPVRSCDDVKPYLVYLYDSSEKDIPSAFLALISLLLISLVLLFLTVGYVVRNKTSL